MNCARGARAIAGLGLAALLVNACSSPNGSTFPWATGPLTSIPTYTVGPKDGSGWSTQLLDQPRPLPGQEWNWRTGPHKGGCQWLTPDLLETFEWTGDDLLDSSPPCVIPVSNNRYLQILPDNVYESFAGPKTDPTVFMRAITIEGLEAREYNLTVAEESSPGSCVIEVNTRSLTTLHIAVGTLEAPTGTDPAPQCELGRRAAAAIARTYVPLAGGTPWARTPQQPTPHRPGQRNACDLVGTTVVFGFIEGVKGNLGTNGKATTCTYTRRDIRADAWHSLDLPSPWHSAVPSLADKELTADIKLGVMPARLQVSLDGKTCAETAEYAVGQALRIAYTNPQFKSEILCRIAEQILGNVIGRIADRNA